MRPALLQLADLQSPGIFQCILLSTSLWHWRYVQCFAQPTALIPFPSVLFDSGVHHTAPVVECVAPAPVITNAAPALVVEYVVPAPPVVRGICFCVEYVIQAHTAPVCVMTALATFVFQPMATIPIASASVSSSTVFQQMILSDRIADTSSAHSRRTSRCTVERVC